VRRKEPSLSESEGRQDGQSRMSRWCWEEGSNAMKRLKPEVDIGPGEEGVMDGISALRAAVGAPFYGRAR
jgi:hypothetical protein